MLISQTKQLLGQAKSSSIETASQLARLRNEYHRLTAFLETHEAQAQSRAAGADRLKEEAGKWESKSQDYDEQLKSLDKKLQAITGEKETISHRISELQAAIESKQLDIKEVEKRIHEKQTRFSVHHVS